MNAIRNEGLVVLNFDEEIHKISSQFSYFLKIDIYEIIKKSLVTFETGDILKLISPDINLVVSEQLGMTLTNRDTYLLSATPQPQGLIKGIFGKALVIPISGEGEIYLYTENKIIWQRANDSSILLVDFSSDYFVAPAPHSIDEQGTPCVDFVVISLSDADWEFLSATYLRYLGKFYPVSTREHSSCSSAVMNPAAKLIPNFNLLEHKVNSERTSPALDYFNEFEVFSCMDEAPLSFELLVSSLISNYESLSKVDSGVSAGYKASACLPNVDKYVGIHTDPHGMCICAVIEGSGTLFVLHKGRIQALPYSAGVALLFDDRDPHFVVTAEPTSFLVGNISNSIQI